MYVVIEWINYMAEEYANPLVIRVFGPFTEAAANTFVKNQKGNPGLFDVQKLEDES